MNRKFLLTLVLVLMASLLSAGCSNMSKEDYEALYGREIFSCNSKNIIGFKGVYIDDDNRVTYVFDERYAMCNKDANRGIKRLFTEETYASNEYFVVGKGTRPIRIDGQNVEINKDTMTISVVISDEIEPEEIDGFSIYSGMEFYNVIFNSDRFETGIKAITHGETGHEDFSYSQTYNVRWNKWSAVSQEEYIPLTDFG